MVRECHFDPDYYKVGDVIGVPWVKEQEAAYQLALDVYEQDGRVLRNLSEGTKLDVIPKGTLESLELAYQS